MLQNTNTNRDGGDGGSDSEIVFLTDDYGVQRAERIIIDKDGNVGIGHNFHLEALWYWDV